MSSFFFIFFIFFLVIFISDMINFIKKLFKKKYKWICEYCGKNTWDVYNDYMGSGTNHLKCELEEELKGKNNE